LKCDKEPSLDTYDIESVAIKENDKPIIPKNIIDAPVLKLLKKKKYMSKKK